MFRYTSHAFPPQLSTLQGSAHALTIRFVLSMHHLDILWTRSRLDELIVSTVMNRQKTMLYIRDDACLCRNIEKG